MSEASWVLAAAATVNLALVACWMFWTPKHHNALASMMGWERRGRKPLLKWRAFLKRLRVVQTAAGAGVFALREIIVAVGLAIFCTLVAFGAATMAIRYAQDEQSVTVLLSHQPTSSLSDTGLALLSHIASVRLQDGFVFTGLPAANISGDYWLTILLVSLLAVVAYVGLRAVAELAKCVWYALVCVVAPDQAREALDGHEEGAVWQALGRPRIH